MKENELLLTALLDCERIDLIARPKALTPEQEARYSQMQARRAKGEPIQYILGKTDFMGIPLAIDERALIPRPETEILTALVIEKIQALQRKTAIKVLDLGVGSGNISIAIAKNVPQASITALDISAEALALAAENAKRQGVLERVRFFYEDMSAYLKEAAAQELRFDVIVSNPPYIPTAQLARLPVDVRREPRAALDGGEDGMYFYREIFKYAHRVLTPSGFLLLEIGDGQRAGIEMIAAKFSQYQALEFYKDYVGTDRIAMVRLNKTI